MIPDFDHPLGGAGEENTWDIMIPSNVVDWSVVSRIGLQKSGKQTSYENKMRYIEKHS